MARHTHFENSVGNNYCTVGRTLGPVHNAYPSANLFQNDPRMECQNNRIDVWHTTYCPNGVCIWIFNARRLVAAHQSHVTHARTQNGRINIVDR